MNDDASTGSSNNEIIVESYTFHTNPISSGVEIKNNFETEPKLNMAEITLIFRENEVQTDVTKTIPLMKLTEQTIGNDDTKPIEQTISNDDEAKAVEQTIGKNKAKTIEQTIGKNKAKAIVQTSSNDDKAKAIEQTIGNNDEAKAIVQTISNNDKAKAIEQTIGNNDKAKAIEQTIGNGDKAKATEQTIGNDEAKAIEETSKNKDTVTSVAPVQDKTGPDDDTTSKKTTSTGNTGLLSEDKHMHPSDATMMAALRVLPKANVAGISEARIVQSIRQHSRSPRAQEEKFDSHVASVGSEETFHVEDYVRRTSLIPSVKPPPKLPPPKSTEIKEIPIEPYYREALMKQVRRTSEALYVASPFTNPISFKFSEDEADPERRNISLLTNVPLISPALKPKNTSVIDSKGRVKRGKRLSRFEVYTAQLATELDESMKFLTQQDSVKFKKDVSKNELENTSASKNELENKSAKKSEPKQFITPITATMKSKNLIGKTIGNIGTSRFLIQTQQNNQNRVSNMENIKLNQVLTKNERISFNISKVAATQITNAIMSSKKTSTSQNVSNLTRSSSPRRNTASTQPNNNKRPSSSSSDKEQNPTRRASAMKETSGHTNSKQRKLSNVTFETPISNQNKDK